MTDLTLTERALARARQGLYVFPCRSTPGVKGDKSPACARGFHAATRDPDRIRELFAHPEAALIGLPTGEINGFDVLDFDERHGAAASPLWEKPPKTRTHFTRSGGMHLFFRHVEGVGCSQGVVGPGLDVRGQGGYAIDWPMDGCDALNEGILLNWPADLIALASAPRVRTRSETRVAELVNSPSTEAGTQALALAVKVIEACADGQKHATIRDLSWDLAKLVNGDSLDHDEAREAILAAAELAGAKNMQNVENLFDSAIKKVEPVEPNTGDELGPLPPLESGEDYVALHELTEDAVALAFARDHASQLRFDHNDRAWFRFEPTEGWIADSTEQSFTMARNYVRVARQKQAFSPAEIKATTHIRFANAIWQAGKSDPRLATDVTGWNNYPMILGVPGGYVDLTTGDMHPPRASDLIRRRTAVTPAPRGTPAPLWTRFLDQATAGDTELQDYLMRLLGYWLTGDMREEKVSFFYGSGGNGKGVIVSVVSAIMGGYAYQAPAELFKTDSRTNREYQLAKIEGRRLVIASETETKSMMAESFVKELSGNEGKINARDPYGKPFEFRSVAKLLLVGNHAPQLQGKTEAMQRRLQVVPFNHRPTSPDLELKQKLQAEFPVILRMMIDGALSWQQRGLGSCRAIDGASDAYFAEQDTLGQWLDTRCIVGSDQQAKSSDAIESFNQFARSRGEAMLDARTFKEALSRKPGFTSVRTNAGQTWRGLSLRAAEQTSLEGLSR